MKGKKKGKRGVSLAKLIRGFSLVELIVVLTIMAIIAALCAPSIAAYVQAAKIQNYQTALDNLVGEVQTQLPQSRYWNWQEVQENAEAILRSDAARGVKDVSTEMGAAANQKIYEITNASTDSNIVYYFTLEYENVSSGTSQEVKISANCDGYNAVTADETCDVLLKTNYADSESYPKMTTTISSTDDSGWKTMDDRVKTGSEWDELFKDPNWDKYNWNKFNPILIEQDPSIYRINTTDYPLNSVKFVQFGMKAYDQFSMDNYSSKVLSIVNIQVQEGSSSSSSKGYPIMGDGRQYAVPKENIYVYMGDITNLDDYEFTSAETESDKINAEMETHNWFKYTDIFDVTSGIKVKETDLGNLFLAKYKIPDHFKTTSTGLNFDPLSSAERENPLIHYRAVLKQGNQESSGGAILINGSNNMNPEKESIRIYVDLQKTQEPAIYKENTEKMHGEGSTYFNTSGLTAVEGQPGTYIQDATGYKVVCYYDMNVTVYVTLPTQSEAGNYGFNSGFDSNGTYIPYYQTDGTVKKIYYSDLGILDGYNNFWIHDGIIEVYYYSYTGTSPYLVQMYKQDVYIDLSHTGYQVEDIFQITLTGVNASYLKNAIKEPRKFMIVQTKERVADGSGTEIPSFDDVTIDVISENIAVINIPWTWRSYPYIRLTFQGALAEVGASVDLKWDHKGSSSFTKEIYTSLPMLTINGNNNYTNITLDWTNCDYINASNITEKATEGMGLKFNKNLDYIVYDKDYNIVKYTGGLVGTDKFYLTYCDGWDGTDGIVNQDRLIHLYCEGVNANDVICEVLNAPESPETAETTTVTTTPTTTTTTTAVPVTETSSTTESSSVSSETSEVTTVSTVTTESSVVVPDVTESSLTEETTAETVETTLSTSETEESTTEETTYTVSLDEESAKVCRLIPDKVSGSAYYFTIEPLSGYKFDDSVTVYANYDKYGKQYPCPGSVSNGWYVTLSENISLYVDGIVPVEETTTDITSTSAIETTTTTSTTTTTATTETTSITTTTETTTAITTIETTSTTTESITDVNSAVLTIENFSFNQEYDISPYFYANENESRIPSKIEVTVSDAVDINTGFNFNMLISGSFNCQYSEYHSWNSTGDFKTYSTNDNNADIATISFVLSTDNDVNHIFSFADAKIKFYNYYASDVWNNIKIESVRFVYDVSMDTMMLQDSDVTVYTSTDFIGPIKSNRTKSNAAVTSLTTTTTKIITTTTTTTTTTTNPVAASENGFNVGLDAESAEMCTITFTSPLFNDSGVCYFTITPKEGYTLSENYTVKVGTVKLQRAGNYSAKSDQWYFWKSSGLTDYTIHVDGITADTAS